MVRRWQVRKKGNVVAVRFNIAKFLRSDWLQTEFTSLNPKDFEKYVNMMMDEFEFRKMFVNSPDKLERYEKMLESE